MERVTGDDTLLAARDEVDQDFVEGARPAMVDESPDGHALAMDERLVAHPPVRGGRVVMSDIIGSN